MALFKQNIAIDFGSVNTLIAVEGQGVTFSEPTVVAVKKETQEIIAIGESAHEMLGKTPGSVVAVRPLLRGTINDFELAAIFLRQAIKKAISQTSLFRAVTGGIVTVSGDMNEMEQRTLQDVLQNAGIRMHYFIEKPIAALSGMGIDVTLPKGNLVACLGGETCEVAVVSLGGIVLTRSLRLGGIDIDREIVKYVRTKYNLVIPLSGAEKLKIALCDLSGEKNHTMEIRGRDMQTNLPGSAMVSTEEVNECALPTVSRIVTVIREVLENTPPEIMTDLLASGINLCGGLSLLSGLDEMVQKDTNIKTTLDPQALSCGCCGALGLFAQKQAKEHSA